jgi:hypothetical protein
MTTRKLVGDIFSAIGNLASLLWLLVFLGFIPEPWIKGPELLANYLAIIVLAIFVASTYWVCYRFIMWRKSKSEPKTITAASPEPHVNQGLILRREEDRPKIEVLLNEAERHSTVWVMGVNSAKWLDDYAPIVREYVTGRDHDLSFIFLAAKRDSMLEKALEAGLTNAESVDRIEHAKSLFQKMKSDLEKKEKGDKIQLGIYDLPLIHSMVVVNPRTAAERIQVTHYLYNTEIDWVSTPNLTLRRQLLTEPLQKVFDVYHESIEYALRTARGPDSKPLVV